MLFSSIPFMYYFLPIILIAYFLVPKAAKNSILLIASLLFYAWGEPAYVFLMAGSIFMGYVSGLFIEKCKADTHNSHLQSAGVQKKEQTYKNSKLAKVCMILAVVISLGLLGYFKYANFFIKNINIATGLSIPLLSVILPIGISFYTFQLISYILDVYRGDVVAQKNPIALATYITMFPQLIAGPIVRYSDVEKELQNRAINFEKIAYGIRRFVLGLGKKIIIANVLGEFVSIFKDLEEKTLIFYWAYAIAVSLQIYFDFSGYSDMAIGMGSVLGFHFPENFNYPFISKNVTEFWRRWHISLGTWFRDYVYIPLGGSRCTKERNIFNIFVVWCLTGLWHGAEWTFVVWGLYFAILLMIEKLFYYKWLNKTKVIGHIYAIGISIISFVIFDGTTLAESIATIGCMLGFEKIPIVNSVTWYYLKSYAGIIAIAILGATPLPKYFIQYLKKNVTMQKILDMAEPVFMIVLLLVATGYLVDGSFNPFLYFRF